MALNSLPEELLDLILRYFSDTLSGLILFSTINRYCKLYVDHSSTWLTRNLNFVPRKEYLLTFPSLAYLDKQILLNAPSSNSQYFSSPAIQKCYSQLQKHSISFMVPETKFPCVFQVEVCRQVAITDCVGKDRMAVRLLAKQVRDWYMNTFVQYQRLWHLHAKVRPVLSGLQSQLRFWMDKYLWNGILALGVICLLAASYSFRSFEIKKFHSLPADHPEREEYNRGFQFIFGYLSTFLLLHLMTLVIDFVTALLNMKKTLRFMPVIFSFLTQQLQPFYFFLLIIFTIMVSLQLIQWQFRDQQISLLWSITTIPLMTFFLLMIRSHWLLFLQQNNIFLRTPGTSSSSTSATNTFWPLTVSSSTPSPSPPTTPDLLAANQSTAQSATTTADQQQQGLETSYILSANSTYLHGIDYILLTLCCVFIFYCLLYDISKDVLSLQYYRPLAYFTLLMFSPFIVVLLGVALWKFYQSFVFWNQFFFGKCDTNVYWVNQQQKNLLQLVGNLGGVLASWGMVYTLFLWLVVCFWSHDSSLTIGQLRYEEPLEKFYFYFDAEQRDHSGLSSVSIGLLLISSLQSFIVFTSWEG